MTKQFGAGVALGILRTILAAITLWMILVYSGAYNVVASDEHADLVRWSLRKTLSCFFGWNHVGSTSTATPCPFAA